MPSTILSDNGASSGTAGLKSTGSNDGQLVLQTTTAGGAATTAMTINTSQAVTFAQTANLPNTFGFKNRIINGAMVIDQRNAGASVNTNGAYPVDRFLQLMSGGGVLTSQRSTTSPSDFINSIFTTVSTADASIAAGDYYLLRHVIEGLNVADLNWGAAAASAGKTAATVTLSFKVRSSVTGTFSGSLTNSAEDRSYPFTYSIASANTWTNISVTVAGDTSGTWLTDNGVGIRVNFDLGTGSTRLGTAGAWGGAVYFGATGSVQLISTLNATFYITGVQLEVGSTATSFDYRDYGTELALCQRYFVLCASAVDDPLGLATLVTTTNIAFAFFMPVTMRTSPTILSTIATYRVNWQSSGANSTTAPTISVESPQVVTFDQGGYTGLTAGNAGTVRSFDPGRLALSSEL